jgi:uncharacterized membrane protein
MAAGDFTTDSVTILRIVGVIGAFVAVWISFCGAWLYWRNWNCLTAVPRPRRWRGIALIALSVILFSVSLGGIVIAAYYP